MPKAKKELETTTTVEKATAKKSTTKLKKIAEPKKTTSKESTSKIKKTNSSPSLDTKTNSKKDSSKTAAKSTFSKSRAKSTSVKNKTKSESKNKTTKLSTKSTSLKKTTKSGTTKRSISTKKVSVTDTENKFINILEYYDLPYRYNETVVKILAQTPKILFVYWDISDDDRKKYIEKYGEFYFNDSYPVLLVHNKTLNYTQEIEINDFANSWYISIPDARCEYNVTLARRFKEYVKRNPDMPHKENLDNPVFVVSSNNLLMPNDHVLLDELKQNVKYRNVKTNEESYKSISHILKDNNILDFYNLYQKIYQVEDLSNIFSLCNPSSGNPTSTFK